jgi:hypothetical protein
VDDFVEALVVFDDGTGPALIAAGGFAQAGGAPASRIARWDGATWSALGAGFPSTVLALAVFDSGSGPELYAGGSFTSPASRIARWTGSAWVGVGGGVDDAVAVMQVFAGELYVGGQFLHAGGNAIDHLAKWTGASWQPVVAAGFDKRVRALAVFDEGDGPRLYVGGWFQSPLGYLGRVEDNQFVSLLEGVDDRVLALATFDDGRAPRPALYVGGQIERAGVFSSPHIARWADGLVPPASSYCTAGTTANGCTASIAASGEARRCSNSGFDVDVTGVEGQKLGILFFGLAPAATHWGGGSSYVCVSPPTTRILTQSSGGSAGACDGAFALDLNTWMFANPYRAPAPGELVYLQAWFRDPPSPKGTSLSNALTFEIAP